MTIVLTDEGRQILTTRKTAIKRLATYLENSLALFGFLAGYDDPQVRAVYKAAESTAASIIREARAIAYEIESILRRGEHSDDEIAGLTKRIQMMRGRWEAIADEVNALSNSSEQGGIHEQA